MSTSLKSTIETQGSLTPHEVSELLQVSVYTVRRWIKEGDLPAHKVGRGWRIQRSTMAEWLSKHQSAGNSQR